LREQVVEALPDRPGMRAWLAVARQQLAWLLLLCPDEGVRDPAEALTLALAATEAEPANAGLWFTIGAARYETGDAKGALQALEQCIARGGADGFTGFYLALVHQRLGHDREARQWMAEALRWSEEYFKPDMKLPEGPLFTADSQADLKRLSQKAAEVMGGKDRW